MTETVLAEAADSANQGHSAAVSTLSTRRAYKAAHERKRRAAAKAATPCPPPTANKIQDAWNCAPISERDSFMKGLGRMRDLRDDFNTNPGLAG